MPKQKSFYITTPIYYVNDVPHIGHAYTTLACDVLARFKRLDGYDVMFLTGTDEHGQKVEKSAAAAQMDPKLFCDQVSERFRELAQVMNFSHDQFIRTTEPRHFLSAQALWQRIEANGHIYKGAYSGWYSVRDEAFYAESELVVAEDGTKVAPTGAPVEWLEEPSYFFDLSKWQQPLLDFYEKNPHFVLPKTRMNEVTSFVKGGLNDLSISRTSFKWGVPVPGDPDHIMYVWIDALTNYITALQYPDMDSEAYQTYWPADVHMVGKDILRFHAVYWPAFMMAAGLEPPKRVFAHGWWTNEGQKISKSLGNVIDPFGLVNEFGLDPVRYFLMREVPFGSDGDFSRQSFVTRANADLANDFGNLAQRCLSMIAKNCDGKVPQPGTLQDADAVLLTDTANVLKEVRVYLDDQAVHLAIEAIWRQISRANGYVAAQEPWVHRKTDPERMATILYVAAEAVRNLAILSQPIVPESMAKLLDQLGVPETDRGFDQLGEAGSLVPGTPLPPPIGIFPRITEKESA